MSALLAIPASELNICAEYGYSSRVFNKYPYVYQTTNYSSALFLVYHQPEVLENRIEKYRNHFALYRNDTSICIARTETLLRHPDNDAIITYDIITPKDTLEDRMRSKYKTWSISFDRIDYSCDMPDFSQYRLIGTGEWWFFDDGFVLNGLTSYDKLDVMCETLFVYYELHAQNKITKPQQNTMFAVQPLITTSNAPQEQSGLLNVQQQQQQPPPQTQSTLVDELMNRLRPQAPSQTQSVNPEEPSIVNSIPSELLPSINATTRQTIQNNDIATLEQRQRHHNLFKSVIPSLFWFDERIREFKMHKIDYFKPLNFRIPLGRP